MRVNNIFFNYQSTGPFIGTPAVFVKFQGCSRHCKWCNAQECWDFSLGEELTPLAIYRAIKKFPGDIVLTGGEPMEQNLEELEELYERLEKLYRTVHLQTSGEQPYEHFLHKGDCVSLSLKPPSSGKSTSLETLNEWLYSSTATNIDLTLDPLSQKDLDYAREIIESLCPSNTVYITPVVVESPNRDLYLVHLKKLQVYFLPKYGNLSVLPNLHKLVGDLRSDRCFKTIQEF